MTVELVINGSSGSYGNGSVNVSNVTLRVQQNDITLRRARLKVHHITYSAEKKEGWVFAMNLIMKTTIRFTAWSSQVRFIPIWLILCVDL